MVLFNKSMSMFDQHKEAQQINGELEKSAIVISRFMLGGGFIRGYTHYSPCMSKSIYRVLFLTVPTQKFLSVSR